ncbi:MAG: DUF362 domain-containing protein [Bacteroidales bacterium]|nr:DUF362 domain-containing protein [Bacteroidales bacterium]MBN2820506.1 DUF362 domain-containing protein [Bacteroidales bacterium]
MKRRDFLRKSVGVTVASGTIMSLGGVTKAFAGTGKSNSSAYDMVAVKGGKPGEMFEKAIAELGGMSAFVKTGQTVVVKPNIGWDSPPERAANTNPELVGKIVEHCIAAGAKKVYVFDNTCDEWTRCYKNSGIESAVKTAGGVVVTGKDESMYREVQIPKGKILKSAKVHELILDSDVFINVPVLKNHGGATMSLTMKNLMGVVWDRGFWHQNDLHQCIADFATLRKPDLNIIDGFNVMKRNGPRGVSVDDVVNMKYQILSADMVASDTAAVKVFGIDVASVNHIGIAEQLGVGTTKLDELNIKRISI